MSKKAINAPSVTRYMVEPEKLTIIGLDTKDGADHYLYDDRIKLPVDEGMVKNIMFRGVLQPAIVQKDGEKLLVVDGRQRVRAAREANKRLKKEGKEPVRIEVKLDRSGESDAMGILISTNEFRRDDTPLAKARKLERYLAMGRSEDEAALLFGVTTKSISNWLKLLELDSSVQKAVEKGHVAASNVASWAKLEKAEQKEKLAALLAEAEQNGGKRPNQRQAAKAAGSTSPKALAPSKKEIKKLIALDPEDLETAGIDEMGVKLLRWAIGDLAPSQIGGLTKLLRQAQEKKAKKVKPKKEPRKPPKKVKRKAPPRAAQ